MTKFEQAVIEEVRRIREVLQQDERAHRFLFSITAEGRVHDGEVKIQFSCGEYSASVTANSVDAAISEWQRRNGFNLRHSGLVLTGPGEVEEAL